MAEPSPAVSRVKKSTKQKLEVNQNEVQIVVHSGQEGKRKLQMPDYTLTINKEAVSVTAPADMPLLWVLRDLVGLTGTKYGCGIGQCGACTVHIAGAAVRSCSLPVSAVADTAIATVEGLAEAGTLSTLQQVWIEQDVAQCGYCQAGQLMAAEALLQQNAKPTDDDIDQAMAGNFCRCGTYIRIRQAIHTAAARVREGESV